MSPTVWRMIDTVVKTLDSMTEAEQTEFFQGAKAIGVKIGKSENPVDDTLVLNVGIPNLETALQAIKEGVAEGQASGNTPEPQPE